MKRIISKKIVAFQGNLLDEDHFKRIRERMFNTDPNDTKEESGIPSYKKTVITAPGMGTNDRAPNAGTGMGLGRDSNESADKSLSSGYNDGGQADDETNPGGGSNPYYTVETNELFMDLKMKGDGQKDAVAKHLNRMLSRNPVVSPHRKNRK